MSHDDQSRGGLLVLSTSGMALLLRLCLGYGTSLADVYEYGCAHDPNMVNFNCNRFEIERFDHCDQVITLQPSTCRV
jgi:hypothetical protein